MEGTSLAAVLSGSPLPEPVAAALVKRVLAALEGGRVRDLSPKSIVLGPGTAFVLPFDAARASGVHMSPEQAHGQVLDARSDVFSAGVLLFHLVCGRPPAQTVTALALGELDAPDASVSPAMKAVLERALKLAPQERFASASELDAALDAVQPSPEGLDAWLAATPARREEAGPSRALAGGARPRWKMVAATAVGLVALLGTVIGSLEYAEHRRAVSQAEYEASLRACGIVSDPPGAQIWLDDKLYSERTPAVLKLERGRAYKLDVRGSSGSVTFRLHDHKRVSVRLQNNSGAVLEDETWDAPPAPATEPVSEPQPHLNGARKIHVELGSTVPVAVFDAESAPDAFTLTPEHEVLVPESLCESGAAGSWTLTRAPMAFQLVLPKANHKTTGVVGSLVASAPRTLGLFFLDARTGRVEVLPRRLEAKQPRTLCLFALNDRALESIAMQPQVKVPGSRAPQELKGGILNVPFDSRLLVRELPANKAWRVKLTPVQVPYPVMIAFAKGRNDQLFVLDRPEVDVPSEAEAVWFTVPVLQRQNLNLSLRVEER